MQERHTYTTHDDDDDDNGSSGDTHRQHVNTHPHIGTGFGTSPGTGAVGLVHALSTLDLLLQSCTRATVICPLLDVNRIKGSASSTDAYPGRSEGLQMDRLLFIATAHMRPIASS